MQLFSPASIMFYGNTTFPNAKVTLCTQMDDQTKRIQTLSIQLRKHNQLVIKYLHQLFVRNPQLGCLASHYRRNPNNK